MSCRIAIFGASGFIGRALARSALARGYEVNALGRIPSRSLPRACHWLFCDLADPTGGIPIPAGTDGVFYLAQSAHYRDFPGHAQDLFTVNAQGTARAALAAHDAGVRFFCYASSGNVYRPSFAALGEHSPVEPHTPYAASKLMGEMAVAAFSGLMQVMRVRIFGAYGPGQRAMLPWLIARRIMNSQAVELAPRADAADGGLHISFTYIDDLVERLLFLAEYALGGIALPDVLNLAGPEPVSLRRFASTMAACLGKECLFTEREFPRTWDLWADTSLLDSLCPASYTPLGHGLEAMCSEIQTFFQGE